MAGERYDWQCCFNVPREEKYRRIAIVSIMSHLHAVKQADPRLEFTVQEDPDSWHIVWVSVKNHGLGSINDLVLQVKKDIETVLNNLIVPPTKPKSVYEWIRENPYK